MYFQLGNAQSGSRWARVASSLGQPRHWIAAAALAALATAVAPWRTEAAGRVALVIVAEDYQKLPKSSIGAKGGNDIAEALQAKGFDVLLSTNPTNSRARAVLLDFSQKANGSDLAIAFIMGHATAADGLSYFLPVNTELGAATDLFSRGISISSIAQVAGKAKAGAVIVLMTRPSFETPIPGLDARPEYGAENPKSVVTVFSSSAKVPISRIDLASEQAAGAVVKVLQQPAPSVPDLVKAASGDAGAVYGVPPEVSLAKPNPPPENVATLGAQPPAKPDRPKAPSEADWHAKEENARSEAARLQLEQAKTELEKARLEMQRAEAEAARAKAEAEKAKAEAQAEIARAQVEAAGASAQTAGVALTPIDEKSLGKRQRERIQERLRDMSLYTGPIDSVMGPLTREAIMGYQRSRGAQVTGYLTPEQFQALLSGGD